MIPKFLPAALVWLAASGPVAALTPEATAALEEVVSAIREEVDSRKDLSNEQRARSGAIVAQVEQMATLDPTQLEQSLGAYTGYFTSRKVTDAIAALKTELANERKAGEKEELAKLTAMQERISKAIRTAKEPSELDGLITELATMRSRQYGGYPQKSEELQRLYAALEPAKHFVERWQDYLAGMKSGNRSQARQALQELKQVGHGGSTYIPRSELLELLNAISASPGQLGRILDGIRTLEDIRPAIATLQGMTGDNDGQRERVHEYIPPLASLDKSYREFKSGLSISLELDQSTFSRLPQDLTSKVLELRGELIKLALPRYVNPSREPQILPGESVLAFLDRIAEEARARGDAEEGFRIKQAKRLLSRGESFRSQDTEGLTAWTAGQNQEAAEQWELAVISYQQALKSGSDLVPATLIGEKLAAIRNAHPEAYESGVERFLSPSSGSSFSAFDRRVPGREDQSRKTGPTLVIPAAGDSGSKPVETKEPAEKQ